MNNLDQLDSTQRISAPMPGGNAFLNLEAVEQTLHSLVRIDSTNPAYGGPEGGQRRALEWCLRFLQSAGLQASLLENGDGSANLHARLEGSTDAPPLLFETHIDTVSTAGMTIDPLAAHVEEGRLWGRGATDAKGQVTAMLHALAAWAAWGPKPERSVELEIVSDEEFGFTGSRALLARGISAAGIIIGEPTGMRVVTTHKGTIRIWIRLEGKAAHAAKPYLGVNAIVSAAALVEAIENEYAPELAKRKAPLLDPPTISVGIIEGGIQANLVPPLCRVHVDRRMIPGETVKQFIAELELLLHRLHRRQPHFQATLEEPTLIAPAVATDLKHPLVRVAGEVAVRFGFSPEPVGVDYATDAAILSESGLPIIIVGPGSIDQAHTQDEYVDLNEVLTGAAYYAELIGRRF